MGITEVYKGYKNSTNGHQNDTRNTGSGLGMTVVREMYTTCTRGVVST